MATVTDTAARARKPKPRETPASTEAAIWSRIVQPDSGRFTREAAQSMLELDFTPADRQRMDELAEKASAGRLTANERHEAETYNRVAHVLALLQSKARQSLRNGKQR
jgi:hypothetical protein